MARTARQHAAHRLGSEQSALKMSKSNAWNLPLLTTGYVLTENQTMHSQASGCL